MDEDIDKYISRRLTKDELSEMRKAKGLSQKELSDISGLSVRCISDIENPNEGNPTLNSIIKYINALGYEIMFQRRTIWSIILLKK